MTRKIGDKVSVDDPKYPGVWTIVSQGPVNSTLQPESGSRRLKCPHYLLVDPVDAATVTVVPLQEFYVLGELVRVEGGKYAGLYVVIKDGGDKVNLAKLGGDSDRYLRMTKRGLTRVDPAEVLK